MPAITRGFHGTMPRQSTPTRGGIRVHVGTCTSAVRKISDGIPEIKDQSNRFCVTVQFFFPPPTYQGFIEHECPKITSVDDIN